MERAVPVDSVLLALMEEFPNRGYNGREVYNVQRDAQGQETSRTLVPTVPIKVPGRDSEEQPHRANDRSGNRQSW